MKTWNEIEQRLKSEDCGSELPAGHHDRIMRAVRDGRAAAMMNAERPRPYLSFWLLAGATAVAVLGMAGAVIFHPAGGTPVAATPSAPDISLFSLTMLATSPMEREYEDFQNDLAAATRFVTSALPGNGS